MNELTSMRPGKFLVCVDSRDESKTALRFACIKAKKRGGLVSMIHVTPPAEVQSLFSIADKIRDERKQEAEAMLQALGNEALELTGLEVTHILREGKIGEEIIATAMEDYDINMLVLGAAPSSSNRGKLSSWLASQLGDRLLIPLMLVPGNLTDQQIEEIS